MSVFAEVTRHVFVNVEDNLESSIYRAGSLKTSSMEAAHRSEVDLASNKANAVVCELKSAEEARGALEGAPFLIQANVARRKQQRSFGVENVACRFSIFFGKMASKV